jgi:hypothetical protein
VIIEARFFLSVFEDSPRWLCTREIQTGFTTAFGSKVPSKMASRSRDLISGFDRSFAKLQAKRPDPCATGRTCGVPRKKKGPAIGRAFD